MPTIAWNFGDQPSFDGPVDTTNSGSLLGTMEVSLIARFIEGPQDGVIDIIIDGTLAPGSLEGNLAGEYLTDDGTLRFAFPGVWYFDPKPWGTWNIRVSVDGILCDGELVVTTTSDGIGYYANLSWGWNPTIPDVPVPFWTRLKSAKQLFT